MTVRPEVAAFRDTVETLAALLREAQQVANVSNVNPYFGHAVAEYLVAHGVSIGAALDAVSLSLDKFDAAMREWRHHGYSDAWLYLQVTGQLAVRGEAVPPELTDAQIGAFVNEWIRGQRNEYETYRDTFRRAWRAALPSAPGPELQKLRP